MPIHISHTLEQIEAAREVNQKTVAVRILIRHLHSAGIALPLGEIVFIMRAFWVSSVDGLLALEARTSPPSST